MESVIIEVQLSIEKIDEKVIAHLVFRNKSEKMIHLNKQTMYYNGVVRNNYMEVTSNNNDKTAYLGMMANCTRKPDEFLELGPGEKISSSIPLSEFYRLTKGNKYTVQYYAYNPSFLKEQQLIEMQSNRVEVSY